MNRLVPTNYYTTPTQHFEDIGASLIIWANHNMRAAITAMKQVSQQVRLKARSVVRVHERSFAPPMAAAAAATLDLQGSALTRRREEHHQRQGGVPIARHG